jgi:Glycosyltransferase Family 4
MRRGSRRPGVLLVVDSFDIGGAERLVTDLALGLRTRSYDVAVAASHGGPLNDILIREGIETFCMCPRLVKRRLSLGYATRLAYVLRERSWDIVHAHMFASGCAAASR